MKTLMFTLILLLSASSFAKSDYNSRTIEQAVAQLSQIAQETRVTQVQPSTDVKGMVREFALAAGEVESAEEFEASWQGDNAAAWQGDSTNWGSSDLKGASEYVLSVLEQNLEYSEQTTEDKVAFSEAYLKAQNAFSLLRHIKTVKYGVGPVGAVQCGFQFAALLVIDSETGKVYTIIMEGSGC